MGYTRIPADNSQSEREEGFEPDGKGGRVKVTLYKDRKVTVTRGGLGGSTSTQYGDFDGPEYVEADEEE